MPQQLNWWIGTIFALGSLLFALASVLSLVPAQAQVWSLDSTGINAIFFAGSIPFTIAAYLQLYQAANAGEYAADDRPSSRRSVLFGWRPRNIGWLSSALQFVGTILFNINTFDAMLPGLDWLQQDLTIWAPDFVGSILFLASGYLAFIETCHGYWAWNPTSISWWVVFSNLLGCIGFMIAAIFALVLPGPANGDAVTTSVVFTLLGAIGFYIGSVLMLPETISQGKGG
jgi:phage shock protein PspC (stress-responsive transcriptional regulator)